MRYINLRFTYLLTYFSFGDVLVLKPTATSAPLFFSWAYNK